VSRTLDYPTINSHIRAKVHRVITMVVWDGRAMHKLVGTVWRSRYILRQFAYLSV